MTALITVAAQHKSAVVASNWVGAVGANGTGANITIPYPSGTQSGDLLVYVHHGGPDATPSGFSGAFTTSADSHGYVKYVKYKLAGAETNMNVAVQTGFDVYLIALRGYSTVFSTHQFNSLASGQTATYTVSGGPRNVINVTSDRGASSLPSISSSGRTGYYTYTGATYFRGAVGFYPNLATNATATSTDYSDTYNTSALFFYVS